MNRLFIILLTLALSSGCEHKAKEFHHSTLKFGTIIDITLYDVDEKLAETAFATLDQDFEYMHSAWSPWEPGSLSRLNVLIPTGGKFSVGPAVLPLIEQSMALSEKTDRLFNPAIGNLINLWQMHKHEDPDIQPPAPDKIAELVEQNPHMSDLKFDGIKMYSTNPAVQLSFGAFAKGYAIDLSMDYLKKLGVKHAIINTGGDLKAIGRHGDRPWRIGIRHPRQEGVIASIETDGEEAVFTSGDYERFYIYEDKRYHHILDPRTGYPAQGTQSVTVIHHDSGLADAAATALFIAGPDHWYQMAQNLGLKQVMLIDDQGRIHLSPQMKQRIQFKNEQDATIILSPPL
ncbi:MAG: FAD:protein FMN transferase [Gammaproteobacteria bacterium]|nr:MAG: FAD:protein FMN transferase [Gammaproteobacteria bacterium]